MKKLKEVVDKQRDEIRAKDRELGLKNEDVEAVSGSWSSYFSSFSPTPPWPGFEFEVHIESVKSAGLIVLQLKCPAELWSVQNGQAAVPHQGCSGDHLCMRRALPAVTCSGLSLR